MDDIDKNKHEKSKYRWQKIASISTALTLMTSTIIGAYGVFLGTKALETATRFESIRIRPLIEFTYSSWMDVGASINFKNIGYGPGEITGVKIVYKDLAGKNIWMLYGDGYWGYRNKDNLNIWTYLGAPDINETSDINRNREKVLTVNWPWIGGIYGPGESVNFLTAPPVRNMTQEWRDKYLRAISNVFATIRLCFEYKDLDGSRVENLGSAECRYGPANGDIIYKGGSEFVLHKIDNSSAYLSDLGLFGTITHTFSD